MHSSHASKGSGSGSGGDDTPKIPTVPISDIMRADAPASPLPYYAVLGGTSRLIAVGGPEERHTDRRHWHSKQEPGRSLMRKVVSTKRQKAIKGDRTTSDSVATTSGDGANVAGRTRTRSRDRRGRFKEERNKEGEQHRGR